MFYQLYDLQHAALNPSRVLADGIRALYTNPLNPLTNTLFGRTVAASAELFERTTRQYGKPEFGLTQTQIGGETIAVTQEIVWSKSFCNLIHFKRDLAADQGKKDPKLLIVAPLSGHYATLLRGTVAAMLPFADVYITDWVDARNVPLSQGHFDLDDYIDYVIDIIHRLGPDTHIMAVCQPSVPVLAAVALMEANGDPLVPASMTLMGGPIDTRRSPTAVNKLAMEKGIEWFRDKVIMPVPFPAPGYQREVYPGFLQLSGFMSMNLDRHVTAHKEFFLNLVKNDGETAAKHREFYDEYLAVMDMTAEFYLQTVDNVFCRHTLPKGEMMHRSQRVDCSAIKRTALLTIEGENDDISGLGQTEAAQDLCTNLSNEKRQHYVQPDVGHYGVFNGSRFRKEIVPRVVSFMAKHRHN